MMDAKTFERKFNGLTDQQQQILIRMLDGQSDEDIAESLGIEASTVRRHQSNIYKHFFGSGQRNSRQDLIDLFHQHKPELVRVKENCDRTPADIKYPIGHPLECPTGEIKNSSENIPVIDWGEAPEI